MISAAKTTPWQPAPNLSAQPSLVSPTRDPELVRTAVATACGRIAPTWPLDRFIAVNPFWGWIDTDLPTVHAKLSALTGTRLLMPRAWFRDAYQAGEFTDEHLVKAIVQADSDLTLTALHKILASAEPAPQRRDQVLDIVDRLDSSAWHPSWREFVTNSISQFCAAYFDEGQASTAPDRRGGLYASWRRRATEDIAPSVQMAARQFNALAAALPHDANALIELALSELGVAPEELDNYLLGLLLDVNGWASWCAYQRWTATLEGGREDSIVDLLAIRLSYELVLLQADRANVEPLWHRAIRQWPAIDRQIRDASKHDWILQSAMEIAWRSANCPLLTAGPDAPRQPAGQSLAQAVFCIDVRSEPMRRALESQPQKIETLGFAGFFGLPIDYLPAGTQVARPQLPGLLAPKVRVTDEGLSSDLTLARGPRLRSERAVGGFRGGPISSFAFVEAMGLTYAASLLRASFRWGQSQTPDQAGLPSSAHAARKPRLTCRHSGEKLSVEEKADLAAGMLRAMSLTKGHARMVLLIGHGSETRNNPHAAGLDCGACCGQSGEVNARAAAALLNEPGVRELLRARGIELPGTTHFVAGLHNTTTDDVRLFDLDELPSSHRADLEVLRGALEAAGELVRRERADSLGLEGPVRGSLRPALQERARDWAQVRPEWGLANNAAFVVGPRELSAHMNFAGRSFLHEYREEDDRDGSILELIMTAPMVVTHWINLQYYASTVDPTRYGSGNKVLHNVVGGRVGVFEGNTGDLRIGLPLQSVHNGDRFVHNPLRLTVMIAAQREAISAVLSKHAHVRNLVDHGWLTLVQLDQTHRDAWIYRQGEWSPLDALLPQVA